MRKNNERLIDLNALGIGRCNPNAFLPSAAAYCADVICTLYNMRKADLIEYVRTLEHNYNVAVSFNENQAKYIESLDRGFATRGKDGKGMGRDFAIEILKAHACCSVTELHCDCDCPLWDKEKGCCRAWTDEEVREAVHLLNGERRSP